MPNSAHTTALLQCDAHGAVIGERTREQLQSFSQRWRDVDQQYAFALMARANLESCERILSLWYAKRTLLPLHPRWDTPLRESVLSRFAQDGQLNSGVEEDALPIRAPESLVGVALLMPTSGSTGAPKLARLTYDALFAALGAHAAHLNWRTTDRWLLSLPPAHIGGMSILLRCFEAKVPVVLPPCAFEAQAWHRCMDVQRVTLASLVPTQLQAFVAQRLRPPASVRAVLVGGAACTQALYDAARALGWPLLRTYGFTEACSQLATEISPGDGMRPLQYVELMSSEQGELLVRAPQLFSGYLGEAQRSEQAWHATGDRGRVGEDGKLVVEGRVDSMIISGGENISPSEVEARLAQLPDVLEACVFGLSDAMWGEIVCALVVTTESFTPERFEEAQRAWPAHLRVRRFRCVEQLPLGPSGKVDRRAARRALESEKADLTRRSI